MLLWENEPECIICEDCFCLKSKIAPVTCENLSPQIRFKDIGVVTPDDNRSYDYIKDQIQWVEDVIRRTCNKDLILCKTCSQIILDYEGYDRCKKCSNVICLDCIDYCSRICDTEKPKSFLCNCHVNQ